jgi:hypothetical protein
LHIIPTASCTELFDASNLIREPNAARTLNTPIHGCLDEWPEVFVLDSALAGYLMETRPIRAVSHGLILEVAFTTLVTNWTVERVVGKEEFHDTLS